MLPDKKENKTLKDLSLTTLEQIVSDFSFTKTNSNVLNEKPDTIFFYCMDRRLARLGAEMKISAGYGQDEAGAFLYPQSKEHKPESETLSTDHIKNNFITKYKLIKGAGGKLDKMFVIGHTLCGAVASLDKSLFLVSRKDGANVNLDEDQKMHLQFLGDKLEKFKEVYKQFANYEDDKDKRLRLLEKVTTLMTAARIPGLFMDHENGVFKGIQDDKLKNSLMLESPRIYAAIAHCKDGKTLASHDLEIFLPELGNSFRLSEIEREYNRRTDRVKNWMTDINSFISGKQSSRTEFKAGSKSQEVAITNLRDICRDIINESAVKIGREL